MALSSAAQNKIYELADGQMTPIVYTADIAYRLGVESSDVDHVLRYLDGKGLIKLNYNSLHIKATGIKEGLTEDIQEIEKLAAKQSAPGLLERAKGKIDALKIAITATDVAIKSKSFIEKMYAHFEPCVFASP